MLEPLFTVLSEFFGSVTTDNLLILACLILFAIFLVLLFKR